MGIFNKREKEQFFPAEVYSLSGETNLNGEYPEVRDTKKHELSFPAVLSIDEHEFLTTEDAEEYDSPDLDLGILGKIQKATAEELFGTACVHLAAAEFTLDSDHAQLARTYLEFAQFKLNNPTLTQ